MQTTQTKQRLFKGRMPELLARAGSCVKAVILLISVVFSSSTWAQETVQSALDSLIDGLHKDAHEGNFETYFARYTSNAVFMGPIKLNAGQLMRSRPTRRPLLKTAMVGPMKLLSGTGKETAIRAGLMRFYSTKNWGIVAGQVWSRKWVTTGRSPITR